MRIINRLASDRVGELWDAWMTPPPVTSPVEPT
jgi:hypothetical protein